MFIKFWDDKCSRSKVQYYGSEFLGHTRATDLQNSLDKILQSVDANKISQIAMDGPNVNKLMLKQVKLSRKEKGFNGLIDVGTCPLHNLHNAFKTGMESTGWKLKETMKGSYQLFKDIPD